MVPAVAHDSADGPGGDCWCLNARPAHPRPVKAMAIIALAFTTAPLHRCTAASGAWMPGVRRPMQACCGAQRRGGPVACFNVGCVCAGCNRGGRDFKRALCGLHQTKTGCERGLPPPRCKCVCGPHVVEGNTGREGGLTRPAIESCVVHVCEMLCGPRV
jgi:hypothetical protein